MLCIAGANCGDGDGGWDGGSRRERKSDVDGEVI